MNSNRFLVSAKKFRLKDCNPDFTGRLTKRDAEKQLSTDVAKIRKLQNRLFSRGTHAVLIILQGMDASGKDSAVKHVLWEVNPAGFDVNSFKSPTSEELDHDFLWRHVKALPRRGKIGVFNRSHYEEVVVVRVHPEFLEKQKIPSGLRKRNIWKRRFEQISNFEKFLTENGIIVLKFFLHVSKEEQRKRFLERRHRPSKRWKFSLSDIKERRFWPKYMRAYESAISNTSTPWAPWYVIPADRKWFTRAVIADVIVKRLKALDLDYPSISREQRQEWEQAKKMLKVKK
ncbi:MAG: Polyphosphate:nucleotide phosphotransferase, PPK2 family [Candidatus Yanofskybacteria bacterium GW2011_GWA2_44_9]|uniref:Polyphosphate:nucleotide phosphotransferase, PPK2 family n=1 Tax=Candidatus Yanofskybacteria bacterium GW2011_GWA2_44_9 TaxID=1619025 RepID=A0A0G1KGB0_9BACT|nr:MAG: Polyphosphate:nucleotide phosphotransferase, PPK2 family [Candidatus Yanofskybacteria bacterium GW2011_GWA2_44_9]